MRSKAHRTAVTSIARRLVVLALAIGLARSESANAAKWHACPAPPLPVYPSLLGATNAPFVHPGHELTVVLNAAQVAASGGFSTDAGGNTVEVSVASASPISNPVLFAPRQATATSPSVLHFTFPDSAAELGHVVAGPSEVRVSVGGVLVAHIAGRDLTALPPPTDVTALVLGQDPNQTVYGALGATGDLWVPATFHGEPMSMPTCPGQFLVPAPIEIGAAVVPGLVTNGTNPFGRIRKVTLYLGDLEILGTNFYGMLFPQRIDLVHVGGTRGVAICRLNDAINLVLRVKGSRAWARSLHSPLRDVVLGAAPVPLQLRGARPMPPTAQAGPLLRDSFGNACEPSASNGGGGSAHP
jgi:hypothetical protein